MKTILATAIVLVSAGAASADTYVNGYYRNNGTYVAPHYRTSPDNSRLNNYGAQGNTNPYTGQRGTVNPYQPPTYNPTLNQYGTRRW
jgi:hypothetical protein